MTSTIEFCLRARLPLITAFCLLLSACGGGGTDDGGSSYTVSATAGGGGSISPSSATVAESSTTSFTVTPDTGYIIGNVSGCSGSLTGNTYTTGPITADCTVSAVFTAQLPTLSVADASVVEGNSDTTDLNFIVSLSDLVGGNVNVDYTTSAVTATAGSDYTSASGTLIINSGTTSNSVTVTVNGDTDLEADETIILTLSNPSANVILGASSAIGTIFDDDTTGVLNDTGITLCGDYAFDNSDIHQINLDCAAVGATATTDGTDSDGDPVPAGQDAHFGRDVTNNDDSDGHAGFSFTKMDSNSNPLPASATQWDCVLDNVTGLMWEVKTDDDSLHDKDWTSTWYSSDSATNGGFAGLENVGCYVSQTHCDTETYVALVNGNGGICGHTDWRLPNRMELMSLVDNSIDFPGPMIDINYFPNTRERFWSSSPSANEPSQAWYVDFQYGNIYYDYKVDLFDYRVRLVRAGQ